ncbi:MAG TPA: acetyl-coenzyme A synthetase N-terminal domain-containing protein, partial [Pelagibacteraceae bacterium]|nr:acetyl-coenzyme A synthetase N-terminal domain-containing protein [Pelagibacteraceae bacterium]
MENKYKKIYDRSIQAPQDFWSEVAEEIFWYKKPTKILNSD